MIRKVWAREAHTSHSKRAGPTTKILASSNIPARAFCRRVTTKEKDSRVAFMSRSGKPCGKEVCPSSYFILISIDWTHADALR